MSTTAASSPAAGREVERILRGHETLGDPRHHAQHRHAGQGVQLGEAGSEDLRIATQPIDDEPGHPRAVGRGQQRQRADESSEHAATVDVAHQQDRRLRQPGDVHVHEVGVAQVDLGRAPRALDDDHVVRRPQARQALGHDRRQLRLTRAVLAEAHAGDGPTADDELRAVVRLGLQEDRVHLHRRLDARGLRLRGLSPADLAAVGGDRGVERHVLRLERRHPETGAREDATEGRREQALAHARRRALQHQARRLAQWSKRTLTPARSPQSGPWPTSEVTAEASIATLGVGHQSTPASKPRLLRPWCSSREAYERSVNSLQRLRDVARQAQSRLRLGEIST